MLLNIIVDPTRMVVISIFATIVLAIGCFFYIYIYPKKKISLIVLLLLISLLPLVSMLRNGTYQSGDLTEHALKTSAFFRILSEGNILPVWSDVTCGGYGCPDFEYLYIFPYYLISFFHVLGFSFVQSVKLLLASTFILSGITMYTWIKDEIDERYGFIAGIFYLFSPYHLVDMHFRNTIGEMVAYAVLPLLFFFTKKIIEKLNYKIIILNAFTIVLLILSHLAITLVTIPVLCIYSFIIYLNRKKKQIKSLIFVFSSIILALFLSCFYWLSIIFESKYIYAGNNSSITFSTLSDLLYSPWRYGLLFQGHYGELSHIIGYTQILLALLGVYVIFFKKINEKSTLIKLFFFIILFFLLSIMVLPISEPIWYSIPFIKSFEFSYRLLLFISLCTSVIAAIVLKQINNKTFITVVVTITIFYTILNWGNRMAVPINNDIFQRIPQGKVQGSLAAPIWTLDSTQYTTNNYFKQRLEPVRGKVTIKEISNLSNRQEFIVYAKTNTVLVDNTFYYPGWKVLLNDKEIPFSYTTKQYPGLIVFNIPKGLYRIDIAFRTSLERNIAHWVSIITVFILLLCALVKKYNAVFIVSMKKFVKY